MITAPDAAICDLFAIRRRVSTKYTPAWSKRRTRELRHCRAVIEGRA